MDRSLRNDADLRAQIAARLQGFAVQPAASAERRAAVAVVVADAGFGPDLPGLPQHTAWSDAGALLLTRRAESMRQHAGQWALPGGRIDAGETPEAAALRELHEEIGLHLDGTAVLGRLDDYVTRSGYAITPVVLWAGAASDLQANPEEVASIHRIPFSEWLRADAPILETTPHSAHPVLKMPVGRAWIAAPTAAIVYQFRELCLLGRPTRVAHFDQPAFAWR
ncbi:NUDIX hydrolase [Rubrivivax sp. RP6-9]|uniref:NUDIX hydrolase n=1 Tax=Rubrivivax sp. RP6-9 TaxID=3415750 RepID=UPI003CC6D063